MCVCLGIRAYVCACMHKSVALCLSVFWCICVCSRACLWHTVWVGVCDVPRSLAWFSLSRQPPLSAGRPQAFPCTFSWLSFGPRLPPSWSPEPAGWAESLAQTTSLSQSGTPALTPAMLSYSCDLGQSPDPWDEGIRAVSSTVPGASRPGGCDHPPCSSSGVLRKTQPVQLVPGWLPRGTDP